MSKELYLEKNLADVMRAQRQSDREALTVGDAVIIDQDTAVLTEVTRVTKTLIICGTRRFNKESGMAYGSTGMRRYDRLVIATDEARDVFEKTKVVEANRQEERDEKRQKQQEANARRNEYEQSVYARIASGEIKNEELSIERFNNGQSTVKFEQEGQYTVHVAAFYNELMLNQWLKMRELLAG